MLRQTEVEGKNVETCEAINLQQAKTFAELILSVSKLIWIVRAGCFFVSRVEIDFNGSVNCFNGQWHDRTADLCTVNYQIRKIAILNRSNCVQWTDYPSPKT